MNQTRIRSPWVPIRMNLNSRTLLGLSLAATLALSGCSSDDDSSSPAPQDTLSRLNALGLTTAATLIDDAGLAMTLDDLPGGYTLLAPTNAAFAALPAATLAFLQDVNNVADLQALLQFHALAGPADSTAVAAFAGTDVPTLEGTTVFVDAIGSDLFVNNARVSNPDNTTSNGIVHIVDTVLRLPTQTVTDTLTEEGYTTLVSLITSAGLVNTVDTGSFTVLAPTEAAFAAVDPARITFLQDNANVAELIEVLQNHLIAGTGNTASVAVAAGDVASAQGALLFFGAAPTVNGVTISDFNRPALGGLVHGIDALLDSKDDDAVVVATANGSFTTLLGYAVAAGFDDDFATDTPLTIFAPTDAAFAALTAGQIAYLDDVNNVADLRLILNYHVVDDAIQAAELGGLATVTTRETTDITVTNTAGTITLGSTAAMDATVAIPDVFSSNAVIHAVDQVLVPASVTLP